MSPPSETTRSPLLAMSIIGGMFFIFGFVTWLNGPLITFVQLAFTLSDVEAFLVVTVFYMSYFFLALPSAAILKKTGMKKGMALGLLVMAVGAAIFGQLATMRIFEGALTGLFIIGAGLALLQTASNPYISILGPIDSAAQRIAFMGICNKIAGILAPIVVGGLVLNGVGEFAAQVEAATDPVAREALLDAFAQKIHLPYLGMAALLAVLAFAVAKSPLPEISDQANESSASDTTGKSIFAFPQLWLGFVALFCYVGVEVMAGDAIGTYGAAFGIPLDITKYFTSFTLVGMLIGYVVGLIIIPRFISQERYLAISAVLGVLFCLGAYLTHGLVSVGFVAALGFANAMMWPAIFPLGIKGLGKFTETGSAILIMGIAGGAVLPQLFAHFKGSFDFQAVFAVIMIPAYLYILVFALFAITQSAKAKAASVNS
ncbi:sugar MFS transporter [Asticcacaulis endophyticus]|uniref:Glucose/galactose MFS transporter n=1 Tax=Asticcacaulis endophyticus TaxID=1395890 RepID=A0A918Q7T4_9CAUL|nr:sugar MFS transporter [Asticcacaulis endophyticus]GGZ35419.1 glucose/galactose MFS transporter [Asticcacaulis endophyticus]